MSQQRYKYYYDELVSFYESCMIPETFQEESQKLMNKAMVDLRLTPGEFYQLCLFRAGLVFEYGEEKET